MRAIICDDKDSKALLDRLQLSKSRVSEMIHRLAIDEKTPREGLAERIVSTAYDQLRYQVVEWLQEQGFQTSR